MEAIVIRNIPYGLEFDSSAYGDYLERVGHAMPVRALEFARRSWLADELSVPDASGMSKPALRHELVFNHARCVITCREFDFDARLERTGCSACV